MNTAQNAFNTKPSILRIHKAQEVRRTLKTRRCPGDIPDEERPVLKMSFMVSRCFHWHPRKGHLKRTYIPAQKSKPRWRQNCIFHRFPLPCSLLYTTKQNVQEELLTHLTSSGPEMGTDPLLPGTSIHWCPYCMSLLSGFWPSIHYFLPSSPISLIANFIALDVLKQTSQ